MIEEAKFIYDHLGKAHKKQVNAIKEQKQTNVIMNKNERQLNLINDDGEWRKFIFKTKKNIS